MSKIVSDFWLGSPESVPVYLEALRKASDPALEAEARAYYSDSTDEPKGTYLLDISDGLATIDVKGALIPFSNDLTKWLGITGYPDIRNALIEAAQDGSVNHILMNFDSPGGSTKGIEDVSALITRVNKEYKPVTAYTNSTMASAAYWLAAPASKIIASKMADVGSIGVIGTHFEKTKQLEMEGIKATVFRAGEFKALGGPFEELTDKARATIQSRLDVLYSEFVTHVAVNRKQSEQYVRNEMADGKEFLGFEAIKVHLIDEVMAIDDVVARLRTPTKSKTKNAVALDSTASTAIKMETEMAKQKVLDDKTVAVISAGGDVQETLNKAKDAGIEEPAGVAAKASTEPTEDAGAGSVKTSPATDPAEPAKVETDLSSYLKTELSAAQEKVADITIKNKELSANIATMSSSYDQLKTIAQDFVNTRTVALGRPSLDMSNMSAEATIQQFNAVTEEFHKAFPVGGKCALPNTEEVKPTHNPNQQAAIKAARF